MSLRAFSRRIRRIGRNVERRADEVVRETALVVDQAVVLATPVDTGRARGNWQVGIDTAVTDARDVLDPSGAGTIAEGAARVAGRRSGQTIFISNNVPYIGRLNEGSSSQAPAMFVEQAVAAGVDKVRRSRLVTRR